MSGQNTHRKRLERIARETEKNRDLAHSRQFQPQLDKRQRGEQLQRQEGARAVANQREAWQEMVRKQQEQPGARTWAEYIDRGRKTETKEQNKSFESWQEMEHKRKEGRAKDWQSHEKQRRQNQEQVRNNAQSKGRMYD